MKLEIVISNELEKIGFKRAYKGYKYFERIVEIIYEEDTFYDFNLKDCYNKVAKRYRVKQSAVKGDINYLMSTMFFNDYNKRRLLDYTGYKDIADLSVKKLIEIMVDKLFL